MGDITELTRNMTIMANGRALRTGNTADLFNDAALIETAALGQPTVVRLAGKLRELGWPVPVRTVTVEQLFTALRKIRGGINHE
jgi:hypothetical protein